jgi:hypothetical protein
MSPIARNFVKVVTTMVLTVWPWLGWAFDPVVDMSALYRDRVDMRLEVPAADAYRYEQLVQAALVRAGVSLGEPQYLAVVDRDPNVQAFLLFWRSALGELQWVGASPVSTGRPGEFEHFETPLGVFDHTTANPDFRSEGTRNSLGIRGYGTKGMRIFDFGWQRSRKGWGDHAMSEMRLQVHATDPDLLERRLGSVQSKGCIRIPASLNQLLDYYGVLDAEYEQTVRDGRPLWVLDAQRKPVAYPGRYLIVVESGRTDRPEWSPAPYIPHRRAATPPIPSKHAAGSKLYVGGGCYSNNSKLFN